MENPLWDIGGMIRRASATCVNWEGMLWLYIDNGDMWITWWEGCWWFQSHRNETFQWKQYAPMPPGPPPRHTE